jgi:aminopeptidase
MWDAVAHACLLDHPAAITAWQQHMAALAARSDHLNRKRYAALHFTGPGTDLRVGLPNRHVWVTAAMTSRPGISFVANLPTEEVFTVADRDRVSGTVRSTRPLVVGGTVVDDFTLRFEQGRIVDGRAARGESMLRRLVTGNPGADRLGEVALVPHSSRVSQCGRLFYNSLFDENAASHAALGAAYAYTLSGGETMNDDDLQRAGANLSAIHVDVMIGSAEVDVDGITRSGSAEPVMRRGEWVAPAGS